MYEPRKYRQDMNRDRFHSLIVREKETDLWIGVSPETDPGKMEQEVYQHIKAIRQQIADYITANPVFRTSLHPVKLKKGDSELILRMKKAGIIAGTGPMAAVAGLVAEETGKFILKTYQPRELVVENGGDIFLSVRNELHISVYAGKNKTFRNLMLQIPASESPLGICTSSGVFGHSLSLGKADSVTVVSKSTEVADALATAVANRIKTPSDLPKALEMFNDEMLSLVCIKDDKIGVKGKLQLAQIPS